MSATTLLRRCAGLLYREGRVYPVPFGPLRGAKLSYAASVNYREMLGLWETEGFSLIARLHRAGLLGPGDGAFFDVGANLGLYSLFIAKKILPRGHAYAFEPGEAARKLLCANVAANHLANVTVEARACADSDGEVEFFISRNHHTSSLSRERAAGADSQCGSVRVPSVTLDQFWRQHRKPPQKLVLVKMDIEGGGVLALKGCREIAALQRCFFLIESHSPAEDAAIGEFSRLGGYDAYRTNDGCWVERLDQVYPSSQGVWGTLLLSPPELTARVRPLFA